VEEDRIAGLHTLEQGLAHFVDASRVSGFQVCGIEFVKRINRQVHQVAYLIDRQSVACCYSDLVSRLLGWLVCWPP
jgi:hypothetical protein